MVTDKAHNAAAAGSALVVYRRQRRQHQVAAVAWLTAGRRRRFLLAGPLAPGWGKWQLSESGAAIMPAPGRRR